MAKVLICDTILRDAHQSQAATRMRLDEMLPICDKLDAVGYHALEVWGGPMPNGRCRCAARTS